MCTVLILFETKHHAQIREDNLLNFQLSLNIFPNVRFNVYDTYNVYISYTLCFKTEK